MKVVFITNDFIIEPLGIMYLSSCLKKAGHQVSIVKTIYNEYERYALMDKKHHPKEVVEYEEGLVRSIEDMKPDIVAYSVTTGMHSYYLRINKLIKERVDAISVFGGPHPTFFPDTICEEGVDAICIGEGDEAFTEFADQLSLGKDVRTIKNFWVKQEDSVYKNDVRPLIENLDKVPFPDRDIIYNFESSYNNPIKNFIIGRGCSYNCTYCFNHAYFALYAGKGRRVRLRTPENVISEIISVIRRAPLQIVYFQDDIFVLSHAWLQKFLSIYVNKINLPYHCHLRADLIDEELLEMLQASGCLSVTLALESGNDYIRNKVLRRGMSREQIYTACSLLRKFGIRFRTENMIGLPGEDLGTALETLRMNIKCKPDIGWASLYQPYPKTVLGAKCQEMGLYDGSLDSIKPSFFEESILSLKDKKKIENLQKLFSLLVEFPFLLPLALVLIRLSPNRSFRRIYKAWKEHCYSRRLYRPKSCKRIRGGVREHVISMAKNMLSYSFKAAVAMDLFSILRWFGRKKILILGYHGISAFPQREGVIDFDYRHIPLKQLERQMVYLKKHYNIMPLSEIARRLKAGESLPNNTVAITFDDGYADIYLNGFELMKHYSIASTVFLISGLVDTDEIAWFDKIEMAFDSACNDGPVKGDESGSEFMLNLLSREDRIKSSIAVKERLKSLDEEQRRTIEKKLLSNLQFNGSYRNDFYSHLNSSQMEKMKEAFFDFGSHSVTHPVLTKTKKGPLDFEVTESKKELSRITKTRVDAFSYPNGSYNDAVENAVIKAGYLCAVTTEYGTNDSNSNLHRLKRVEITGIFSFEYFVCSLFPWLKKAVDGFIKSLRHCHEDLLRY